MPNDMKMLAFLAGELTNLAHYFTTFVNVNQRDVNDVENTFSFGNNSKWKLFSYEKRCSDALKVMEKKK